jgi:protoheme IX farnesyltransferase
MSSSAAVEIEPGESQTGFSRADFMALTKARLSMLVIVTTVVGYWLGSRSSGLATDWGRLIHTVIGSTLAACAASVFNQLMEIDIDSKMARTADRPLPAKKIPPAAAFTLGWVLAALGIIHLGVKVNAAAAAAAAATMVVYVFVYTPMKRHSSLNTLVGAVAGALPPLIGWFGAGGGIGIEAWFLFGLLFFWQLPHFVAINWMYREEYENAGFVMWSNGDVSGRRTSRLALVFSLCLTALTALPLVFGFVKLWAVVGMVLLGLAMVRLALKFSADRTRPAARKLFLFTLLYLPGTLGFLILGWSA